MAVGGASPKVDFNFSAAAETGRVSGCIVVRVGKGGRSGLLRGGRIDNDEPERGMFSDTPLVMVEDSDALASMVERLSNAPIIGIDTESDSFYAYQEKVCLIQLSDADQDYIVDPLGLKDLSSLGPILANPEIVKILHGADYDIVCLKRDFGFQFSGVFDTLVAAQLLGLPRIGLGDLIGRYFGHDIDKQYQRHNWALRPLRQEHLDYARGDTHWLLALREILMRRLRSEDRVRHLEEECALLEQREWQGRTFDEHGYLKVKRANTLDEDGLRVLRRVWMYRESEAKRMNRPTFKVIPDDVLLRLAAKRPTTQRQLDDLFSAKSALKRRHGAKLLQAVGVGLEDDIKIPKPRKKKKSAKKDRKNGPRPRLTGRTAERALAELKDWRNKIIHGDSRLNPFTVASNTTLRSIARMRPRTLDELGEVPDVRAWQVVDFGDQILEILDRVDP